MKLIISIKDPNIECSVVEACQDSGLPDKVAKSFLNKFFEYGEYSRIELDTETMSARVMEV